MKKVLIWFIKVYQAMPLSSHYNCRHFPRCSDYMIDAINEYGSIKGVYLGIKRILRCRPHGTSGYDPVPKKEELN